MTFGQLAQALVGALMDLAPVLLVVVFFQALVLRRQLPHMRLLLIGTVYVVVGLALFRLGLDTSVIPVGSAMAGRLARLGAGVDAAGGSSWLSYGPVYAFAAAIGFAATLVEPTLIMVADRVRDLTGGGVRPVILRMVVAAGVASGLALGAVRVVTGVRLEYLLASLLLLMLLLSLRAPRPVVALAYDTGPMATSIVTVPLITALGVGLVAAVPGRTPLADGFGLVVLALLSPVVSVLALTELQTAVGKLRSRREKR